MADSSNLSGVAPRPTSLAARGERGGPAKSEGEGQLAACPDLSDIRQNDWVERRLPPRLRPFARLARLDRPIGTWLLLFPGWWGIALASQRWPDPVVLLLFAMGAAHRNGTPRKEQKHDRVRPALRRERDPPPSREQQEPGSDRPVQAGEAGK